MRALRWTLFGLSIAIELTALAVWLLWRTRHTAILEKTDEPVAEPKPAV